MKKAVTIGTFDGVHRGHQLVLDTLKREADTRGLQPVAITFDRHPLELVAPSRAPGNLMSTDRKAKMIRREGVEPLVLPFTEQLRSMRAYEWLDYIHRKYDVELLVAGYDNTFGSDGINLSISDYRQIGKDIGIEVIEAPLRVGVSSSAIRKAIANGDITGANDMLGRHFLLPGNVVPGNRLGRTIGFPTANLQPAPGIAVPGGGVYAAKVVLPDSSKHPAMVNIGVRPTIKRGTQPTVEAHIIGWEGDLYGKDISLLFYSRLRDEKQFKTIDELRHQLEADKTKVLDMI